MVVCGECNGLLVKGKIDDDGPAAANGLIDKRIQNLDNLYDLNTRWAARNKAKLLEATTFEHIENEGRERFMAEWRMRQDEKMIMDAFKADT